MSLGSTKTVTLPSYSDPESQTVTLSAVTSGGTSLPAFVTLSGSTFTVTPTLTSQVSTVQIDVTLSDGINSPISSFTITVQANQPPAFASPLGAMTCDVGQACSYTLPAATDPEGSTVTLSAVQQGQTSLPGFMTLAGSVYSINPTLTSQIGSYTIQVTISDGFNSVQQTQALTVSAHQAPYFSTTLVSQSVEIGQNGAYSLPPITKLDGTPVTVSVVMTSGVAIPACITYSALSFSFYSSSNLDAGSYDLSITLNDGYTSVVVPFNVVFTVPLRRPPVFNGAFTD